MRRLTVPITEDGAFITLEFGVSKPKRLALRAERRPVPRSVRLQMLVDTGCSHSMIGEGVIAPLELQPRNSYAFQSASTLDGEPDKSDEYDVSITIGSIAEQNQWLLDAARVMTSPTFNARNYGLLGRDILDRVQLDWHGPSRRLVMLY